MAQHRTSSGHLLSTAGWLDAHFQACQIEYEDMLRFASFQPGSRLLDAGTGSGSFIPSLLDCVGPTGYIYGLDMAAENVARLTSLGGTDSLGFAVGSVQSLPFADDSLDGIWCANVSQFFVGSDLENLLAEFRRVLRPGGALALKDVDMTGWKLEPAPPLLGLHLAEACITGDDIKPWSWGSLRGRSLRRLMQDAGFGAVSQRSFTIERWAPLEPAELQLWSEWLPYLAALAEERGVPAEDMKVWRELRTSEAAHHFISRPDFYGCELQVVAVGRK